MIQTLLSKIRDAAAKRAAQDAETRDFLAYEGWWM